MKHLSLAIFATVFTFAAPALAQTETEPVPPPAAPGALMPSLPNGGRIMVPTGMPASGTRNVMPSQPVSAQPQPAAMPGQGVPAQTPAASPGQATRAQMPTVGAVPQGSFPALPPSRSCKPSDIPGVWQLKQIYESPASSALADYSAQPYQWIYFRGDSTYSQTKSPYESTNAIATIQQVRMNPQQQYLMHSSGFMFFYKNGVAIDTQACFVVVNPAAPFQRGYILLMPPQGQSPTRVVKVYQRVLPLAVGAGDQPQPPPNNRRRRRPNPNQNQQQNLTQRQLNQQRRRQQRLQQQQQNQQQPQQQNMQQPAYDEDGQ